VVPKNIQLLTPWRAVGGSQRPTFLKERVHQNWNFQKDYGCRGSNQKKINIHGERYANSYFQKQYTQLVNLAVPLITFGTLR